jgi:SAM-dependent methyltransferase
MMKTVYEHPKYYEIAYSFRDIGAEVDVFEQCFKKYAELPVKSILELGSGNSPHMEELLKRGYVFTGIDTSDSMLSYSREKASRIEGKATLIHADMIDFSISESFDFAFIALGSLFARNTEDILSHFRSVTRALKKGGLYLMDRCVRFAPFSDQDKSWTIEQDKIKVTARSSGRLIDAVEQLVEVTTSLEVKDDGSACQLFETDIIKVLFAQEFLPIIERTGELEFVGWWNNWNLQEPITEGLEKIARPITLLRRK